jgi:hypothetical protein
VVPVHATHCPKNGLALAVSHTGVPPEHWLLMVHGMQYGGGTEPLHVGGTSMQPLLTFDQSFWTAKPITVPNWKAQRSPISPPVPCEI